MDHSPNSLWNSTYCHHKAAYIYLMIDINQTPLYDITIQCNNIGMIRGNFCAKNVLLHSKPFLWNAVMSCQHI